MRRLALIAPLILTAAAEAGPGLWFVGIAPQAKESYVWGVSPDGSVAVGNSYANIPEPYGPGFTWTQAGGRYDFGLEQGMPGLSAAVGIAADNSTIVGEMFTGGNYPFLSRAYRRVGNGPLVDLGMLPNEERAHTTGVSGDGQVVVGWCERTEMTNAYGQAYRWTPQTGMQGLGYLKGGGSFSKAYGISRDGSTIVGSSQSGGIFGDTEAFMWTSVGGMKKLPDLPGTPSDAWSDVHAVNADGTVVVGYGRALNGYNHPTRWVNGQVEDIAPDLLSHAHAFAVDDSGNVVGGSYGDRAWVWTLGTGFIDFEEFLAGFGIDVPVEYRLSDILSISSDGLTFGGKAYDLVGKHQEGFVVTIPAPGAGVIFGAAVWIARRRRG